MSSCFAICQKQYPYTVYPYSEEVTMENVKLHLGRWGNTKMYEHVNYIFARPTQVAAVCMFAML